MSDGDFGVTPEVLRSSAESLAGESKDIRATLTELDSQVALLSAHWDGAAKEAYAAAHKAWTENLSHMEQVLARVATMTEEIADGYVSADKSSAGRFTHH